MKYRLGETMLASKLVEREKEYFTLPKQKPPPLSGQDLMKDFLILVIKI